MLEFSFVWLVSNIEKFLLYDVVMFESDTTWIDADFFHASIWFLFGSNTIHDSSRYMPGGVCEATDKDVVMIAAFRYLPGGICEATHVKVKK